MLISLRALELCRNFYLVSRAKKVPQAGKDVGLAKYAEETSEAAHAKLKPNIKCFCVSEQNKGHAAQLIKAAVAFSSVNFS